MNLVAKEYVACRSDLGGALVLSEFTGAADELRQAYLVNPHDLDGVKNVIETAITQTPRTAGGACGRCDARCSPTTWTAGPARFWTRWRARRRRPIRRAVRATLLRWGHHEICQWPDRRRGRVRRCGGLPAAVADPPPPPPMPTITGVYDYHEPDAPLEMWVIYSTCVPLGCTLHISTTVPHTSIEKAGEFRLTSGQWAATIPVPDGVKCDDGSHDYTMETYTFDSNTLAGTHTTTHAPVCGCRRRRSANRSR